MLIGAAGTKFCVLGGDGNVRIISNFYPLKNRGSSETFECKTNSSEAVADAA